MKPSPARTLVAVPVFPLPDFYLFPGTVAPLHIFETRYRQMMADLMDGPGRLVLSPLPSTAPRNEFGPVLPELGTLAEVLQHEELPDGRWLTLLLALDRVNVHEVPSDRLYRKVDATVLPEPEPGEADALLVQRLLTALQERTNGNWSEPVAAPVGRLADVLLHALPLDPARKGRAYRELDSVLRAALALAWHEMLPRGSGAAARGENEDESGNRFDGDDD